MHLKPYQAREVTALPLAQQRGWRLKRYAIFSAGRAMDDAVVAGATGGVFDQLPAPGDLRDADGNHGVGFQILHFAEQVAAVSSQYFWQWGSVLARMPQMRSDWAAPAEFGPGRSEVVGCVWEMQIVTFETELWTRTMLSNDGALDARLASYLSEQVQGVGAHA